MTNDFDSYLRGERLYGDDLPPEGIEQWYEDEREGYASLGAHERTAYRYEYHEWNRFHAFRHVGEGPLGEALGFGAAWGHEFEPVADRLSRITIVDPSDAFRQDSLFGLSVDYVRPRSDGALGLEEGRFGLITCLGVLHHIPNVTTVVPELERLLTPGGYLVVREPIVSMGDWRASRPGLTKHERGIPLHILRRTLLGGELRLVRFALCDFPLTIRLFGFAKEGVFNHRLAVRFDAMAAAIMRGNLRYHATGILDRLRPCSAYFVLRKPEVDEPAVGR